MTSALLGGSFDPVHAGHVAMVAHILAHGLAERVLVVPNWCSPWREPPVAAADDRLAMCRLAFAGRAGVEVDDRELAAGRPAFTVDTLEALAAAQPGMRWRLVIGADHLGTFRQWRAPERILELAELLILERAGAEWQPAAAAALLPEARLVAAPPFDHPVSASGVRAILASGQDAAAMLPPGVAEYIRARGLYRVA